MRLQKKHTNEYETKEILKCATEQVVHTKQIFYKHNYDDTTYDWINRRFTVV